MIQTRPPSPISHPAAERWFWTELISFDNTADDFGVRAYLETAGFVPEALSLLLFNADFIHDHDGMERERELPYDCCSYGGRPHGVDRDRQAWTSHQLRGLLRELQRRGIATYFAVFDMFVTQGWIGKHPEVLHVQRDGGRTHSVCPWKRLSDGTYYEEFFVRQLCRVMEDYGFDGYHGADGYAHPRIPIYSGDFSDDMVGQFTEASGVALPDEHAGACDDGAGRLDARALWILAERRAEWTRFYVARTARFWRKVVDALHARGKRVVLNSIWTRDPFEAIYRYGVDYRELARAGVDALIVEAAAAASETERPSAVTPVIYDFTAMVMLISACVPGMKLIPLNGIHDTQEQWDCIRHAPMSLETEIHSLANVYRHTREGLRRCISGFTVCLADSILDHEWQWLQERWRVAFSAEPKRILGPTLIWSAAALEMELETFAATRRPPTHRLLHQLIARNAPVRSVAGVADLDTVAGPILVLNAHLFPQAELARVLAYQGGPVLLIGAKSPRLPEAALWLTDVAGPDPLLCSVQGAGGSFASCRAAGAAAEGGPAETWPLHTGGEIEDPRSFVVDLPCRDASEGFLKACARLIRECAGGVAVCGEEESIKAWAMEEEGGRLRIQVSNDRFFYARALIDAGRPLSRVQVVSAYPGMPVVPDGSRFLVRVPPRGTVVLDASCKVE